MKSLSTFDISNFEGTKENFWDIQISNNGLKTNKQTIKQTKKQTSKQTKKKPDIATIFSTIFSHPDEIPSFSTKLNCIHGNAALFSHPFIWYFLS